MISSEQTEVHHTGRYIMISLVERLKEVGTAKPVIKILKKAKKYREQAKS